MSIDLLPSPVVTADLSGSALQANAAWTALTGQTRDEWLDEGWLDILPAAERGPARQSLSRCAHAGRAYRADWTLAGSGAAGRVLEVIAAPALAETGARIVVATFADVTVVRALMDRLQHEASHDSLTGLCNRGAFLAAVTAALARQRAGDATASAVLFVDIDGLKRINDTEGHTAGDGVLQLVARGIVASVRPTDLVARYGGDEFTVLCEGVSTWEEATAVADRIRRTVEDVAARAAVSVSVGVTLTENARVQAEDVVHQADRAMYRVKLGSHAAQARRAQLTVAAADQPAIARLDPLTVAAHELRTPLATITQAVSLLRQRGGRLSPGDVDDVLGIVERQSVRLARLVDDLLDAGQRDPDAAGSPNAICFLDVVIDAIEAAPPPDGRVVTVDEDAPSMAVPLVGARASIVRVIVNLLTNAYRYGGSHITISATCEGPGTCTLVVEDDGPGIPDDLLPIVFAPFTRGRTRGSDHDGGAGLGLAISRRIVESFGGQLALEAAEPHGARFAITLATDDGSDG